MEKARQPAGMHRHMLALSVCVCVCAFVCSLVFLSLCKNQEHFQGGSCFVFKVIIRFHFRVWGQWNGTWFNFQPSASYPGAVASFHLSSKISPDCPSWFRFLVPWGNLIFTPEFRHSAPHNPKPTPPKPQIWLCSCYHRSICVSVCVYPLASVCVSTLAANLSCTRLCIPGIAVVDKTVACNINAAFYCGW